MNLGIYDPARCSRNEADRARFLQEYEARETPESKLVKDLDRLELILQAIEYERCELSPQDEPTGANSYISAHPPTAQDVRTLAPFFLGSMRESSSYSLEIRFTDVVHLDVTMSYSSPRASRRTRMGSGAI